jgi:glutamate formiminotransferase
LEKLAECVANFSEGRRTSIINDIVDAIATQAGVSVLGVESDSDHHRSVVTFAGAPQALSAAAFAAIRVAARRIDMTRHHGQHPRIGAADVIPFIPLRNMTMAECVDLARSLGARVGAELRLPVFLYADAALRESNQKLSAIRRGGYERLRDSMKTGMAPQPDFGPRRVGSAGGCAIGARAILIAFNVYLATADLAIAQTIARAIRESSGGLPHVQALGFFVKGRAQVSMNLTNYRVTSMGDVVERIRLEARSFNVVIESSEIIGLLPRDALAGASASQLQIANFGPERLLETHLGELD